MAGRKCQALSTRIRPEQNYSPLTAIFLNQLFDLISYTRQVKHNFDKNIFLYPPCNPAPPRGVSRASGNAGREAAGVRAGVTHPAGHRPKPCVPAAPTAQHRHPGLALPVGPTTVAPVWCRQRWIEHALKGAVSPPGFGWSKPERAFALVTRSARRKRRRAGRRLFRHLRTDRSCSSSHEHRGGRRASGVPRSLPGRISNAGRNDAPAGKNPARKRTRSSALNTPPYDSTQNAERPGMSH